jgi:hypothetical protein
VAEKPFTRADGTEAVDVKVTLSDALADASSYTLVSLGRDVERPTLGEAVSYRVMTFAHTYSGGAFTSLLAVEQTLLPSVRAA